MQRHAKDLCLRPGENSVENRFDTERLLIRPLVPDDAKDMFRYRSDPEISRYQNWEPKTLQEMGCFIQQQMALAQALPGKWRQFGIFLRQSHKMAGDVGIHVLKADPRQAEVGITLAKESQGLGLATEALHAVLRYLFLDLGKHRVFASVDPRNKPSVALLERVGMRREAHFVESLWFKGAWADDLVYAMLCREFPANPMLTTE